MLFDLFQCMGLISFAWNCHMSLNRFHLIKDYIRACQFVSHPIDGDLKLTPPQNEHHSKYDSTKVFLVKGRRNLSTYFLM